MQGYSLGALATSVNAFFWAIFCLVGLNGCGTGGVFESDIIKVSRQNELDMRGLPINIQADTLRLDSTALEINWLLEMLSRKNVQMIELVPRASATDPHRSYLASCGWMCPGWSMPVASYMFVQLRLSNHGDESCLPDSDLGYIAERLRNAPFHPGTCLSMKTSLKSEARYRLRYVPKNESRTRFARWEMLDTQSGMVLASLSTADEPGQAAITSQFQAQSNTPFVTLALLVDNRSAPRSQPYQIYLEQFVPAKPQPFGSGAPEPVGQVASRYQFAELTHEEARAAYSAWSEKWARAIQEAERTGWGYDDATLVDQSRGVRLRLHTDSGPRILAGDAGFYVLPPWWADQDRNWVAYYDAQGRMAWKVWVMRPVGADDSTTCRVGPSHVKTNDDEIILEGYCDPEPVDPNRRRATLRVRRIVISKSELARATKRVP